MNVPTKQQLKTNATLDKYINKKKTIKERHIDFIKQQLKLSQIQLEIINSLHKTSYGGTK